MSYIDKSIYNQFCETQWRHSVKIRLKKPLPHTSFCETQWLHSGKSRLYKNPPSDFIVLASSVKTKEVELIEIHRIRVCKFQPRDAGSRDSKSKKKWIGLQATFVHI